MLKKFFKKSENAPAPLIVNETPDHLFHYLYRAKSLYDRNNELKTKFPSPDSLEFERYIDTEAILYIREIQEVGVPFPSWQDMLTVGGETDLRIFLNVGYDCYRIIRDNIPADLPSQIKVLDFGVGCGRTMRFFFRDSNKFECYGCDVDHNAIQFLTNSVPFIRATVNGNQPPLPYETNHFQLIYSISVFTHLGFEAFQAWLKEMHRVLAKDGILQLTLHGNWAFSLIEKEPDRRKMIGIVEEEFNQQAQIFKQSGFTWLQQPVGSNDIDVKQYGISFITKNLFENLIAPYFQLVSYQEAAISTWQDFVVIRKREV